jgi:hypothetical protein
MDGRLYARGLKGRQALVLVVVCICFCVSILTGCDSQGSYRRALHDAQPASWKPDRPCDGSTGLMEAADYGCTYYIRGSVAPLATQLVKALRAHDFETRCGYDGVPYVAATRGDVSVHAELYSWEAWHGGSQPPDIPRGQIFVDVFAKAAGPQSGVGARSSGFVCSPTFLRQEDMTSCISAWNADAGAGRRKAVAGSSRVVIELTGTRLVRVTGCDFQFEPGRCARHFSGLWHGDSLAWDGGRCGKDRTDEGWFEAVRALVDRRGKVRLDPTQNPPLPYAGVKY